MTTFYRNETDDDFTGKRPDSTRTHHARSLTIERRNIRSQYQTNGGRF